jgi:hypothetical protein
MVIVVDSFRFSLKEDMQMSSFFHFHKRQDFDRFQCMLKMLNQAKLNPIQNNSLKKFEHSLKPYIHSLKVIVIAVNALYLYFSLMVIVVDSFRFSLKEDMQMSSFFHFNAFTIICRNGWSTLLQKIVSIEISSLLKEEVY